MFLMYLPRIWQLLFGISLDRPSHLDFWGYRYRLRCLVNKLHRTQSNLRGRSSRQITKMFLCRKLKEAKIFHYRPLAYFSSNSVAEFNQLEVIENGKCGSKSFRGQIEFKITIFFCIVILVHFFHFRVCDFNFSCLNIFFVDKTIKITEPDAFEAACKSATHPKQILSILPTNQKELLQLPGETLVRALQSIAILQKANKEKIRADFITSHPSFEQLCRCIKKCSTIFTPSEMIRSLRSLIILNVPTNSEISLVLLNLLRHEINFLTIDEIIQLDHILCKTEKSSELQKAVEKALPIVFDIQVKQQLDTKDSTELLLKVISFLASHYTTVNDDTIIRICEILYSRRKELTAADALTIVHSLCKINRLDLRNVIKLLSAGIQILMDQNDDVKLDELLILCRRLTTLATNSEFRIHSHTFSLLQLCCNRIVQSDAGLRSAIYLQIGLKNIVSLSETLSLDDMVLLRDYKSPSMYSCSTLTQFIFFSNLHRVSKANHCWSISATNSPPTNAIKWT